MLSLLNNHMKKTLLVLLLILCASLIAYLLLTGKAAAQPKNIGSSIKNNPIQVATSTKNEILKPNSGIISEPINSALTRITKKPFGIKVSPSNSPVSPEKFSGYHTGVDFETLPDEQNTDVNIYAVCTGPLVLKKYASGYGGVAVQQCKINNMIVTIIYGHLKLTSIIPAIKHNLKQGDKIGILGKGYSSETDGERKHLHLGIHKGASINLLGYVQNQTSLNQWIDAETLLK